MAKAIKNDLQDFLTNNSRQKEYFNDYKLFDDGEINIEVASEKLKKELEENFNRHYQSRKEKWEKNKKEAIKIFGYVPKFYQKEEWEKSEKERVFKSDLEPSDHQEIAKLIRQIQDLAE